MGDIQVRTANNKDVEKIGVLFDAYRQFYKMDADLQRATSYIRDRVAKNESVIFLAEDSDGNILAFCQLYPTFCSVFADPIFTLYDLFVESSYRERGIGKTLLLAAEDYARSHGAVRMDLRTAKSNMAAQALYESANWKMDEIFFSYSKFLK